MLIIWAFPQLRKKNSNYFSVLDYFYTRKGISCNVVLANYINFYILGSSYLIKYLELGM